MTPLSAATSYKIIIMADRGAFSLLLTVANSCVTLRTDPRGGRPRLFAIPAAFSIAQLC